RASAASTKMPIPGIVSSPSRIRSIERSQKQNGGSIRTSVLDRADREPGSEVRFAIAWGAVRLICLLLGGPGTHVHDWGFLRVPRVRRGGGMVNQAAVQPALVLCVMAIAPAAGSAATSPVGHSRRPTYSIDARLDVRERTIEGRVG